MFKADIKAGFDEIDHSSLMERVRNRIADKRILGLVKAFLKAGVLFEDQTRRETITGVPQGGILAPMLSNVYLTEVDKMLEHAKAVTRYGKYTYVEYARFSDDVVILIDAYPRHDWLMRAVVAP